MHRVEGPAGPLMRLSGVVRKRRLVWVAVRTSVGVACIGLFGYLAFQLHDFVYYAEARSVARLAKSIPGVEVIEVDGWHDLTLQHLWMHVRFEWTEIRFVNVTEESFSGGRHGVRVAQCGDWFLCEIGFESEQQEAAGNPSRFTPSVCFDPSCHLTRLGGETVVLTTIPSFLSHLDEAQSLIERIPAEYPGLRVVKADGTVWHFRRELRPRGVEDKYP